MDEDEEAHTVPAQGSRTSTMAKRPPPFSHMQAALTGLSPAGPLTSVSAGPRSRGLRSQEKLGASSACLSLWLAVFSEPQ